MSGESYFTGFVSFIAFMVTFLVLLRAPLKTGWFLLEILTGVVIHTLSSIAGFILIEGFSYWYQASLYAFLWFCFFFVSSIYSASVSIGIISYLYDQPQYTASLQDVYQNCVVNVFEQRVEFLVTQGLAQKTGEGYISTPKGVNTATQLQSINKMLGMENQGFYSSPSTLTENRNTTDGQHN